MENCFKSCRMLACYFTGNEIVSKYHSRITNTDKKKQLFSKRPARIGCPGADVHQRCFVIKGVLRNFVKSTGKHLC